MATTSNYNADQVCACLTANYPTEALSAAEVDALIFMREEEKLAHDVYVGMNAKWGIRVFSNISNAEQRHMDAILCLINKYKLDDPIGDNGIGVFKNTDLQALYSKLMEKGSTSVKDALTVGATIEDLDISDLAYRLTTTDNADIKAVFNELTRASRNHMRAFYRNLKNQGVTYVPKNISLATFNEIISTSNERGGSICGICPNDCIGNGPGKGPGNCNGNGLGNGSGPGPGNGLGNGNCPNGNTGNGPGNGGGNGPNGPGNGGRR
ncbi:MAG: DUF2202 domain-containing protein [Saprospiraceae bacterium]|nr:DUF2202 domain-containing protein [Saprospiraceae bacterium]